MKSTRLARLYLPPTFALTLLTGPPLALADSPDTPSVKPASSAGVDAGADDAGADAADGGEPKSSTGCGGEDVGGAAFLGAGCC